MCLYSDFWKIWEKSNLAPYAIKSDDPWYAYRESEDYTENISPLSYLDLAASASRYKNAFEIDRERIINSQAFRRLEYKTQMFVNHEGDNYRTRLTHTLEVVAIGRYIAKALRLNESLVEAIGLGHDLGHAPFGHAGEDALNEMIECRMALGSKEIKENLSRQYYFCHNRQSLEVVEQLEKGYDWDRRTDDHFFQRGMDLSRATREGIVAHTNRGLEITELRNNYKKKGISYPGSLEAQVIRLSDEIAQRTHDLEDGLRSGLLDRNILVTAVHNKMEYFLKKVRIIEETVKDENQEIKRNNIIFDDEPDNKFPIYLFEEKLEAFGQQFEDINLKNKDKDENQYDFYMPKIKELFAIIARLLFIWRDGPYLEDQEEHDSESYDAYYNRILKYLHIYLEIVCLQPPKRPYITAFLKGLLISNVIEHSYSKIRAALSRNDKSFQGVARPEDKEDKDFFLIFIDLNPTNGEGEGGKTKAIIVRMSPYPKDKRPDDPYIVNEHESKWPSKLTEEAKTVIEIWLTKLNEKDDDNKDENKYIAEALTGNDWSKNIQILWLNKDKDIRMCSGIKIINDVDEYDLSIGQVQIYFRQLTMTDEDAFDVRSEIKRSVEKNSIISLSPEMAQLDDAVEQVIIRNLHFHSKVERMNVKGKMMIKRLFEHYWKYPRVMHKRVWERMSIYRNFAKLKLLPEFIDYECSIPTNNQIQRLHDTSNDNVKAHLLLCRRVVDHISGMTDRFIYDEYDRLFSTKKEIESPEELYFGD